jgi:4-phosphopantoate--beta-alanine ligase
VIDLNPLSRSARTATVPIVDNVIRAVPNVTDHARELRDAGETELRAVVAEFDAQETLVAAEQAIREGDLS